MVQAPGTQHVPSVPRVSDLEVLADVRTIVNQPSYTPQDCIQEWAGLSYLRQPDMSQPYRSTQSSEAAE